ncbi:MAG: GDSL-type esterase/lipase family protein, partial [Planctomycetota bacterium]
MLFALTIASALALQSPDPATLRILAIGDDYVAPAGRTRAWPERLEVILTERLPDVRVEVENEGVRGDTTGTALHRLRRDVLERDPDVVVLQYGQSDAWVDLSAGEDFPRVAPGAFRSNLVDLVGTVRASSPTALVVLAEPGAMVWTDALRASLGAPPPGIDVASPYEPDDPWGLDRLLAAYAGIVRDVGQELRVPVVSVHAADRVRGTELVARNDHTLRSCQVIAIRQTDNVLKQRVIRCQCVALDQAIQSKLLQNQPGGNDCRSDDPDRQGHDKAGRERGIVTGPI